MHPKNSLRALFTLSLNAMVASSLITSASAQIWGGGGSPDPNWSNTLNWDVSPVDGNTLTFDGVVNTTTFNDILTTVGGITFNAGAGAFTHNGNNLTLTGNILNNSLNVQTFNLNTIIGSTPRVFDSGAAGLTFNGNLTGSAASGAMQEVRLFGNNGSFAGQISSGINANAGIRLNVTNAANNTDTWTLRGNNTSTLGGQLIVSRGVMNYGTVTEAPNTTITRVSGGNISEFFTVGLGGAGTAAAFNMRNGTLTLNDGQNNTGTTSIRFALGNVSNTNGASGTAEFNQSGGTVNLIGFNRGSSPGIFGANQNGTTTAFNFSGNAVFNAPDAPMMVATRGVGSLTISNNASVTVAQLTVNDDRAATVNLTPSVGTVNLDGGTLKVTGVRAFRTTGGPVSQAIFNFNGGALEFRTNGSIAHNGGTDPATFNVKAGGAIIDTAGWNVGVNVNLEHEAALGANQDGGLEKRGLGNLTLTMANTFNGVAHVRAGMLTLSSSGSLVGSVAVLVDAGAGLTLENFAGLNDNLALYLVDTSTLNLNFTGTDTIYQMVVNGVNAAAGTYSADGTGADFNLSALYGNIAFSGTGILNIVAVPEPSSFALLGLGALALAWRRRATMVRK